jgi:hypothetical protein
MQLTAKLVAILPEQTVAGKNGTWTKQDIILETDGQYPKKVCISLWGDKYDKNLLKVGSKLTISFDIESREFNGKWYTNLKGWKVEGSNEGGASYSDDAGSYAPPVFEREGATTVSNDDCPF